MPMFNRKERDNNPDFIAFICEMVVGIPRALAPGTIHILRYSIAYLDNKKQEE